MRQKPLDWTILLREALWEENPLRWLYLIELARLACDGLVEVFPDKKVETGFRVVVTPKGERRVPAVFLKI